MADNELNSSEQTTNVNTKEESVEGEEDGTKRTEPADSTIVEEEVKEDPGHEQPVENNTGPITQERVENTKASPSIMAPLRTQPLRAMCVAGPFNASSDSSDESSEEETERTFYLPYVNHMHVRNCWSCSDKTVTRQYPGPESRLEEDYYKCLRWGKVLKGITRKRKLQAELRVVKRSRKNAEKKEKNQKNEDQ